MRTNQQKQMKTKLIPDFSHRTSPRCPYLQVPRYRGCSLPAPNVLKILRVSCADAKERAPGASHAAGPLCLRENMREIPKHQYLHISTLVICGYHESHISRYVNFDIFQARVVIPTHHTPPKALPRAYLGRESCRSSFSLPPRSSPRSGQTSTVSTRWRAAASSTFLSTPTMRRRATNISTCGRRKSRREALDYCLFIFVSFLSKLSINIFLLLLQVFFFFLRVGRWDED